MKENIEWLELTGYKQINFDGSYVFEYREGNYRAYNSFSLSDVIQAPLNYIIKVHENFLVKAGKKEMF